VSQKFNNSTISEKLLMEFLLSMGVWIHAFLIHTKTLKRNNANIILLLCLRNSDGSGFKNVWPGSSRVWSGMDSHLWFGNEFGKFPLKTSNFSIFFPLGQKVPGSEPGRPLIYWGSKVCSGRVGSGPISTKKANSFSSWAKRLLGWVLQLPELSLVKFWEVVFSDVNTLCF